MTVGKWKLAVVSSHTGGTYNTNGRTTLSSVKDALAGFGWKSTSEINYISASGTENEYSTYYTTFSNKSGAKLWVGYSVSGCQLHYSCFAAHQCGSYADGPKVTLTDGTSVVSGGWAGGLLMSMIPPGCEGEYGTPNTTDNTWMPEMATPIVGHLAVFTQGYTTTTTLSTTARTPSTPTLLHIFYQDNCFLVAVSGKSFSTLTDGYSSGYPKTPMYMIGKIFESTSELDNQSYSKYGWWCVYNSSRDSSEPTAWGIGRNSKDIRTTILYNGFINAVLPTTMLSAGSNIGSPGFFKADGSKFNLCGPNGYFFCYPIMSCSLYTNWLCDSADETLWSPLALGIYATEFTDGQGVTEHSGYKGVLRSDMIRSYGLMEITYWNDDSIPARGTFIKDDCFCMGPDSMALPWNPTLDKSLCPWSKTTWDGNPPSLTIDNNNKPDGIEPLDLGDE